METIFLNFLDAWRILPYIILFIGMILEGEIILFTAFYLAEQGRLDLGDVIFVSIIGVFVGDMLWYKLGSYLQNSSLIKNRLEKISWALDDQLKFHTLRTLFITKFTYGFHHISLIRAGSIPVPFSKYLRSDWASSLSWVAIIGGLGFFTSASVIRFKHYLRFAEVGILIGIIVLGIISHSLASKIKKV